LSLRSQSSRANAGELAPVATERAFRDALGCYATGVAVLTSLSPEGLPFGLTINSFSSLSLDPPLILWSLRKQSPLAGSFAEGQAFTVNVLSADQPAMARQFATPRDDRFEGVAWCTGPGGTPHLEGVAAAFDCRVWARHSAGDHELLIGHVDHFVATPAAPLLYVRGAFRHLSTV